MGTLGPDPARPEPHAAPGPARPWYVSLALALVAVTLLIGGAWSYSRLKNPFPFYGTTYTPPQNATLFTGTDQNAKPYTFAPKGKTTALFFGFTHCPNICPLTLSYLNKLRERLTPAQRQNFQVVLLSVDPQRDTPALLKQYVDYFSSPGSQTLGINVPEPQLSQVAKAYGAGYSKADIKGPNTYQINHTTATYLIDRSGQIRLIWDYTQLPDLGKVQADVQEVMR